MNRREATTVVLIIASWMMGALMGSQIQRPRRFPPGVYFIEPTVEDGTRYMVDFDRDWQVRQAAR